MGTSALRQVKVRHPSGSSATAYAQGAHITSWIPAGSAEGLFMGFTAEIAEGKTIRGGIPVVFPQFAKNGPLPQHGFVRRMLWGVDERAASEYPQAVFRISDDEATRAVWPHSFAAELSVRLSADALRVELSVENTDTTPISFTCALHTYLRVGDVRQACILGLGGTRYLDKTAAGGKRVQETGELTVAGEVDRIYLEPPPSVELVDAAESRNVRVASAGFANIVVWNPWSERVTEFSGLAADDYLRFICIEAATAVDPITVRPGESWAGSQELSQTGG